ncbi:hypothetical protein DMY87_19815 [Rhizobium wuzhouense]|uniref:Uncharacterized protein n=1 Tax=Rhizobium wuzhouense TaxID=1986026 RepID=A0ABX5NQW5_9HYPH|nr:hypothetical protein DMY87_19815 [Rhizobium wuzhouense]
MARVLGAWPPKMFGATAQEGGRAKCFWGDEVDQKSIEAVGFMKVGEFMWHWIRLEEAVNTALCCTS